MRTIYSGICCDLASHGYVVAAVEHRWASRESLNITCTPDEPEVCHVFLCHTPVLHVTSHSIISPDLLHAMCHFGVNANARTVAQIFRRTFTGKYESQLMGATTRYRSLLSGKGECRNNTLLLYFRTVIFSSNIHRDRSAAVCMRRVPQAASTEGEGVQYQDDWLEFYHRSETEKEFPLRNRQVSRVQPGVCT